MQSRQNMYVQDDGDLENSEGKTAPDSESISFPPAATKTANYQPKDKSVNDGNSGTGKSSIPYGRIRDSPDEEEAASEDEDDDGDEKLCGCFSKDSRICGIKVIYAYTWSMH